MILKRKKNQKKNKAHILKKFKKSRIDTYTHRG